MGVRFPEERPWLDARAPREPSLVSALALAAAVLFALLANGRPIGSGDTRANEHVAASLAQEGDFDLDEYPEIEPPFARPFATHRLSVYPVLAPLVATPVFAASRLAFALDEVGSALAGKLAAALLSAAAAAVLYLAIGRRRPGNEAARAAALFALGTSVWSTSQALWQHPAAVLALAVAVLFVMRAEYDPAWAGRAGLPLACAVAARYADVLLVVVLAVAIAVRWPRRIAHLAAWAAPPTLLVLAYNWWAFGSPLRTGFLASGGRFTEPWGSGHLGLLLSPARGLLVYTPLVLIAAVGLVRAARRGQRWLAASFGAAAVAHWIFIGRWTEWHGGQCWGPRMLTDVLPLLLVFLPDGFEVLPRLGTLLAALSVAAQSLGAFAYDQRWDRLYMRGGRPDSDALWSPRKSPLLFYVQRRALVVALPTIEGGHARVRERRVVLFGPRGSRVRFEGAGPMVEGAESTLGDVCLERGAEVEGGRLLMRRRWDGLFLRVPAAARARRLELRASGTGRGLLYVGEESFWAAAPRWTSYPVAGRFLLRHPYHFAESGGPDLTLTVGRAGGEAAVEWVALVPPSEPIGPLRLP